MTCRCTAGGTSLKCAHRGGGHLQGSRFVPCSYATLEAGAGCQWQPWAQVMEWGRGNEVAEVC